MPSQTVRRHSSVFALQTLQRPHLSGVTTRNTLDKKPTGGSVRGYDRVALSFKAIGGGIWDYDIEADTLYCNERWYEIMGLSPTTDPVRSVADMRKYIFAPDAAAATEVNLHQIETLLARDEPYHTEFRVVRPTRETRWIRSVACVIRDDAGHLRAVGCITDVTEYRFLDGDVEALSAAKAPATAARTREHVNRRPVDREPPPTPTDGGRLTARERECLRWVSVGKTAWETAAILRVSKRTVEFHLRNATAKLNAANKIHAAATAIRMGLL